MEDSPLVENFHVRTASERHFADPIQFWDETLRDGEQMPGVHFSPEEKLRIATVLSDVGVSVIDAGIPVVSPEEAAAVRRVVGAGLKAKILASARTVPGDVEAVIQSGASHIAIFVAASEVHLRYKLKMTQDQVLAASLASVRRAKDAGLHVAFVTEDTVRAPLDFVERLYKAVQSAGADRLVVSDTVGIMTPITFRWYLEEFERRVHPKDWSVHCHNDFGLAVANTLTACEVGVTAPHVCVNGLGERAGNASLEEVVVSLEALYGVATAIDTSRLFELSRLVEEVSGVPIPANKALVGYNSFSHEAGIHTHGVLAHTLTYEPLQPEVVGRHRQMILGKHTGKAALVEKLKERGVAATDPMLAELLRRVKESGEGRGKEQLRAFLDTYRSLFEHPGISDAEFWRMVDETGIHIEAQ
ncbi:MAG: homoaconitate hydratase [Thermoplasmata archaeon]|nr:homoaconitate hydratase [Thermoplasmata archaeon]MCI4355535.1 homoaconitate hydratase [Thermoplasmata archaeon]